MLPGLKRHSFKISNVVLTSLHSQLVFTEFVVSMAFAASSDFWVLKSRYVLQFSDLIPIKKLILEPKKLPHIKLFMLFNQV